MRATTKTLFVALLLVTNIETVTIYAKQILSQVHVVTRHGSRTELRKTATSTSPSIIGADGSVVRKESGESLLTSLGAKQLYDLGVWLRERYGPTGLQLVNNFDASDIRLESSDVERTISSAMAMSLGLFPPETRDPFNESLLPDGFYMSIPIHMVAKANDIYIRAYERCPVAQEKFVTLYDSPEWKGIEEQNMDFLRNLPTLSEDFQSYATSDGYIPLKELWNVYDAVNIVKTECENNPDLEMCNKNSGNLYLIPDMVWETIQNLSDYAELTRYSNSVIGDLLGGNLLYRIYERMDGTAGSIGSISGNELYLNRSFYHYSAHYPTILSLLAALNVNPSVVSGIPSYAAAVIFELYRDDSTGEEVVYMLYKEGGQNQTTSIVLPGTSSTALPLSNFEEILNNSVRYSSPREWCIACKNEISDVCLISHVVQMNGSMSSNVSTCTGEDNERAGAIAAGSTIGGIILGIALLLTIQYLMTTSKVFAQENDSIGNNETKNNNGIDNTNFEDRTA